MSDSPDDDLLTGQLEVWLQQRLKKSFKGIEEKIENFKTKGFLEKSFLERSYEVSFALFTLLKTEKDSDFLLPSVVDYISRISKIVEDYTFATFERWLNHYVSDKKEQRIIRGKIAGKQLPREAYQVYFPVGMGQTYWGPHFVTAHSSPDLDTIVASFWGWVDAFAAKVGDGAHIWNIPGGAPGDAVEMQSLFTEIFGEGVFASLSQRSPSLDLTSLDLMDATFDLDNIREENIRDCIVQRGGIPSLEEWPIKRPSSQGESVRQETFQFFDPWTFTSWFSLITISGLCEFGDPTEEFIKNFIAHFEKMPNMRLHQFATQRYEYLDSYCRDILQLESGTDTTFRDFAHHVEEKFCIEGFSQYVKWCESESPKNLSFDQKGELQQESKEEYNKQEEILRCAVGFLFSKTFNSQGWRKLQPDLFVTDKSRFVEIEKTVKERNPLSVMYVDTKVSRSIRVGKIHRKNLDRKYLGTVTLRDFCNREVVTIPAYLRVISAIDHHKGDLQTDTPPTVTVGDVQSSNVLVAQKAFLLNDRYGRGGIDESRVDSQIAACQESPPSSLREMRIYRRLLRRKEVTRAERPHSIHPVRECIEYLHFIYAILDDTDFLHKLSRADVECMASLLNRLASLVRGEEFEVIDFEEIEEDADFTKRAVAELWKSSICRRFFGLILGSKMESVEWNLQACARGKASNLFSDVKTVNRCSRVGQTKLFSRNHDLFAKVAFQLRTVWCDKARLIYEGFPEMSFHLHMISTIPDVDDLAGVPREQKRDDHRDELWIWMPDEEHAIGKLSFFLSGFGSQPALQNVQFRLVLPTNSDALLYFFKSSLPFLNLDRVSAGYIDESYTGIFACLQFDAGRINSRKAMISPYLPSL